MPVIAVVISEGGSGGALALSVADRIVMYENAIYSILSPEGFASILWKDASKAKEASEVMGLTSFDLYEKEIIDKIIEEPGGGIQVEHEDAVRELDEYLIKELKALKNTEMDELLDKRYNKYRKVGKFV